MHPSFSLADNRFARTQHGFTLIELMIAVAIAGILAGIAYPQYGEYVKKARRADAHLALLQEVQNMERCKSTNYSYANCNLMSEDSPEGHYKIEFTQKTPTTYTLKATGVGSQANDTDCNEMTLNHQDARTPAESYKCWPN